MHHPPTPSNNLVTNVGPIPTDLTERLKGSVPRQSLIRKIESAVAAASSASKHGSAVCVITGEPGSGKTFLAAQLIEAWNCPAYFVRVGNADGFIWKDAKRFLISLGLQLRARYGKELFGPPLLKVRGKLKAGPVGEGGKAAGVEIDKVSLSPFKQILIDVDVSVEELTGEALLVHIGEVVDITEKMSLQRLAQEALYDPLKNLAVMRPDEQVRIVVDSLDDSHEITRSIPFGPELEGNVVWVLTSQPGDHLDRFVDQGDLTKTVRFDLSDGDIYESSIDDAARYALARLSEPSLSALLKSAPVANRPVEDVARDMGEMSNGNFLYLFHLINGIQAEAEKGQFELIGTFSAGAHPQGLDGIYRYLLTNRIRTEENVRNWREQYTPVLGVLAVARAPLVSTQITAFSGVDQLAVDEVIGAIRQFLEPARVPGDLAYYIYHRSFADFLLTQDKSRNPYPLRSSSFYHARIADSYESMNDSAWSVSDDRYAMIHLPTHLVHAQKLDRLCQLMRGAFGKRQIMTVGPAQTHADSIRTAQAAALQNEDELFFQMVEFSNQIAAQTETEWESGRYVLSLLNPDPQVMLERTGMASGVVEIGIGGQKLPWSGFLVAERLLDLGAPSEARDVLRMVQRRAWVEYRLAKATAVNMSEGAAFDFVLQEEFIGFLVRVAQADSLLALSLTKRLFPDNAQLPNVRTAWREVIRAFLGWRADSGSNIGSEMSAVECKRLADTTIEWLRSGGYILGWAGLSQVSFELLIRALPAVSDPMWLVNAVLTLTEARLTASEATLGAKGTDENGEPDSMPGVWAAVADVMTGTLQLIDSLRSSNDSAIRQLSKNDSGDDSDLITTLTRMLQQYDDHLPHPSIPTAGGYSYRASGLSQLSWSLHEFGSKRWKEFSEAALAACEVDGSKIDPPLGAVIPGLIWLKRIPEPALTEKVEKVIAKLALAERVNEAEHGEITGRGGKTESLEALEQDLDAYRRGRIVLSLWRRNAATVAQIESSLQKAVLNAKEKRARKDESKTTPHFSDLLAEALVVTLTTDSAQDPDQVAKELDLSRTPARQLSFKYDSNALRWARITHLKNAGDLAQLRRATEAEYEKALGLGDLTEELKVCQVAISFDPDLADRWFTTLREKLENANDLGTAIAYMVAELQERRPERLNDLGAAWAADLPKIPVDGPIAYYQILICEMWGKSDIFRPQLIELLNHFTANAARDIVELWLEAQQFEEAVKRGEATKEEDSPDEDDALKTLAGFISAAGHITIRDNESNHAAMQFVSSIIELWKRIAIDMPQWRRNSMATTILSSIVDADGLLTKPGPIPEFIAAFFENAITKEKTDDDTAEDSEEKPDYGRHERDKITLGASLSVLLKQSNPEWSEARFQDALTMWDVVLVREPARASGFDGIAEMMMDTVASSFEESFRSSRERRLFELTQTLTNWCCAEPFSAEKLVAIQARLSQVGDTDLRSQLLGVVATGWLQSEDWERATHLADVVGADALIKAGFYRRLRALAKDRALTVDSTKRQKLRSLVLDAMLSIPLEAPSHAFEDALAGWFSLRTHENVASAGAASDGDRYLRRMADWTVSTLRAQHLSADR